MISYEVRTKRKNIKFMKHFEAWKLLDPIIEETEISQIAQSIKSVDFVN